MQEKIVISTNQRDDVINITKEIQKIISKSEIKNGLCNVYTKHTTTTLIINENDDAKIQDDIIKYLKDSVKRGGWAHDTSGKCNRTNADAHIKSSIIGSSQTIPIIEGNLGLGTWQAVMFIELDGPRQNREITITIISSD